MLHSGRMFAWNRITEKFVIVIDIAVHGFIVKDRLILEDTISMLVMIFPVVKLTSNNHGLPTFQFNHYRCLVTPECAASGYVWLHSNETMPSYIMDMSILQ